MSLERKKAGENAKANPDALSTLGYVPARCNRMIVFMHDCLIWIKRNFGALKTVFIVTCIGLTAHSVYTILAIFEDAQALNASHLARTMAEDARSEAKHMANQTWRVALTQVFESRKKHLEPGSDDYTETTAITYRILIRSSQGETINLIVGPEHQDYDFYQLLTPNQRFHFAYKEGKQLTTKDVMDNRLDDKFRYLLPHL